MGCIFKNIVFSSICPSIQIILRSIFTIQIDSEIWRPAFPQGIFRIIFYFLFALQWQMWGDFHKIIYYNVLMIQSPASYKISRFCLNRIQGMQQEISACYQEKRHIFKKFFLVVSVFELMSETLFLSFQWVQWVRL